MTGLVVGVDFSMTSTGIALSTGTLARFGSKGTNADDLVTRHRRLTKLAFQVVNHATGADLVLIEGPSFASKGGHPHDRSGGWWLVVDALLEAGHTVVEVPPTVLKKYATGKGNAGKDLVLAETVRRYPMWAVDGNDVADALVLCAMGSAHRGFPMAELPETHRVALRSVRWPVAA